MRPIRLIASIALAAAITSGLAIGFPQKAAAQVSDDGAVGIQTVSVRRYLGPQYWIAWISNVSFSSQETVYELQMVDTPEGLRAVRNNGRFGIVLSSNSFRQPYVVHSGDYVYLELKKGPPFNFGWFSADTENHPTKVLTNDWYPSDRPSGPEKQFFIEKSGGSPGPEIRFGDPFYIRGTRGNAWLSVGCGRETICLRQSRTEDDQWTFVEEPPEVPPDQIPAPPGGGSSPAPGSGAQSASGCVVQTLIGPTDVWKYRNTCSRTVRATVRRTCIRLSGNDFREVSITVGAEQDYDFNRPLMFGSYCEPPYNTLTEGVVAQVYE